MDNPTLLKSTYVQSYAVAADKLKTLLSLVTVAALDDYAACQDTFAALERACVAYASEINTHRESFASCVGYFGHSDIYDSQEWLAYNDALRDYSDLKKQVQLRGKDFLVADGKKRLANLSTDAELTDKADAVFAAHGIPHGSQSKTVAAIAQKDTETLREILGYSANKASRALFALAAGIRLERTAKGIYSQIDAWAGVSEAQRDQIISGKKAALLEKRALQDLTYAWDALVHYTGRSSAGEIRTVQVAIVDAYHAGYTEIKSYKRGVVTSYWMYRGAEGFGYPKLKAFNTFIKAALSFGGLEMALATLDVINPVVEHS